MEITTDYLIHKIGALVLELDIVRSQLAEAQKQLEEQKQDADETTPAE